MKIPPPVAFPAGALAVEAVWTVVLTGFWMLVQGLWGAHLWQAGADFPAAWWMAAAAGVLWLLWNVWRLRASPVGELRWEHGPSYSGVSSSNGCWIWFTPAWRRGVVIKEVHCTLDLDWLMLLHLRSPTGLAFWVWCSSDQAPSEWRAFRRAVHAHRHKDLHVSEPVRRS